MMRTSFYSGYLASCIGAVALVIASPAGASDMALNISANVVASPCVVTTTELNVDLGQKLWTSELAKANDATDWVAFSFNLTGCPDSTTKVVATMSGDPDPTFPDYYQNAGDSKNVAIDVMDDTGQQQLSNGKTMTVAVDNKQHTAVFNMKGRVISPAGGGTSGAVKGHMELTLAYQ